MDVTELRVQNYRECLKQAQRYIVLTMGTAVAVWLLRAPASSAEPVELPGIFVRTGPVAAKNVLLGVNVLVAALAGYTVETSHRLAHALKYQAELSEALFEYPSIASSPWPAVRLGGPLIAAFLVGWSQMSWALRHGWSLGVALGVVIPLAPYLVLVAYLWKHPNGRISPLYHR
jgi:hypothetical protein